MKPLISFGHALFSLCVLFLVIAGGLIFPLSFVPVVFGEETSGKNGENPAAINEKTDAEWILSLLSTIETDEKTLTELKKNLAKEETEFSRMTTRLEEVKAQLQTNEDSRDKAKDAPISSEGKLSEAELNRLKDDYALYVKHVDLTLVAKKITARKINALEKKIENDRKVLRNLRGAETKVTETKVTETKQLIPQKASLKSQTKSSPVLSIVQGSTKNLPVNETKTISSGKNEGFNERAETPEQIEARKEAEERSAEAQNAERAVSNFMARKKSLQKQIELDEKLLSTSEQSVANLNEFLKKRKRELKAGKDSGADREVTLQLQKDIESVQKKIDQSGREIVERKAHLTVLRERFEQVQVEKEEVVTEAEEKREVAEEAQRKSVWLESPFHPNNLLEWVITKGPRILMVLVVVIILLVISRLFSSRLAKVLVRGGRRAQKGRDNRAETLALSFGSAGRLLVILVGVLMVFQEAGMDLQTVLGGAAILGLAVAFGAQNLMRDYFSGFVILLEDQYELGDIVTIGNMTGTVEKVNMRTTVLRDLEGRVHFIPNGEITQVTNNTFEWARAVFDIDLAFDEDVDKVMGILLEVAGELAKDPEFSERIVDEPVMLGVNGFGESTVTIKFMMKTKPDQKFSVKREMLRRIKNKFDQLGIRIPVPRRMVLHEAQESV
jgi:small-conductance mechanosensitive channel